MTSCATRVALAASLALAACGPIPGGSLSGHPEPPPPAWNSVLEDDHDPPPEGIVVFRFDPRG